MKIVKAKEMTRIEKLAYASGASEEEFMNSAGEGVAEAVQQLIAHMHLKPIVILLCGRGNNAGDAYVAGRILLEGGFHVYAYSLAEGEHSSELCRLQGERFFRAGGIISYVKDPKDIAFEDVGILVDGILGTGFHGRLDPLYKAMIEKANASGLPILSIDLPSGLDGSTGEVTEIAIQATETLFLGLPKSGCFLGEAWNYTGNVQVYNFGLDDKFINEAQEDFLLIDDDLIHRMLPKVKRTRHKYQAGYVVGLGGSLGMPGAPILASYAALRSGAGIVRLLHPEGMESELAPAPYELIRQGYREGDSKVLETMEKASAVFVGPGIGTSAKALSMISNILPKLSKPCVIDAEALTLLAAHSVSIPKQTIMTPHHGEMKKLLGIETQIEAAELIQRSQKYCDMNHIILVLKGAPTFIFSPNSKPYICSRGNPGMATAGSGDVLTGVIAAFLAQVKNPIEAALLGVQFHSIAGEHAASRKTLYSMIASDIIESLPWVFNIYTEKYARYQVTNRSIPSSNEV